MILPRSRLATLAGLALASLLFNLLLLTWSGFHLGGDTVRYTEGAAKLAAGLPLDGIQRLFPAYIGVLAASTAVGFGNAGVVGLQILVAALAAVVLYQLGSTLAGPTAGLVAAVLFVLKRRSRAVAHVRVGRLAVHLARDHRGIRHPCGFGTGQMVVCRRHSGRCGFGVVPATRASAGDRGRRLLDREMAGDGSRSPDRDRMRGRADRRRRVVVAGHP